MPFLCCAKSVQFCPTLCNPIDWSPPGSSVHGILQAGMLENLSFLITLKILLAYKKQVRERMIGYYSLLFITVWQKNTVRPNDSEILGKRTLSSFAAWRIKLLQHSWEVSCNYLKKVKIVIWLDFIIPHLRIYPGEKS